MTWRRFFFRRTVLSKLDLIQYTLSNMAINQAQFDSDLKDFIASISTLIQAVDAALANVPAADLSAEDQSVKDAAAAVSAELAKLAPASTPAAPTP